MGHHREHATVVAVSMVLLVLLSSEAGDDSRGVVVAAIAVKQTTNMTIDECSSEEVVKVTQDSAGHLSNGISSYYVTITNTCLTCTVRDVLISCGKFATTDPIQPSNFRRVTYGNCLVNNGRPIAPSETISFEYSNSFIYSFDVVSFSCHGI
ncbi:hypothetical protein BS78_02G314600 [Paspalum vaginatum]|nr:hypothetical protein BS78_02G314600 [Paspalum vaginatum]